ncbi:phosphotransferase family protein [Smaragdicoccus niigatensis]|uniref:phosphotransferase family protein n=1 Tax=Smaragdicoccus niigatensis TaxID=359359 RepID=UPI000372986A
MHYGEFMPDMDFSAIAEWMNEQGLPDGPIVEVEPLKGGTQNLMYRFRRGGEAYVFRRPPMHLRAKSNEVLRREMRVLGALESTPVPAPRLIAGCADDSILGGAVFYLMEPIDGFNPATMLPALHAGDPAIRHQMGLNAATGIAALGAVDYEAAGLTDFGKPDGFLERQVGRWMSELESYNALDGYAGPQIPGLEKVAAWLEANRPADWQPGIMHGDCHLANLMFAYDGPALAAIVDWEMCTIGDPLLDLGWLLATWPGSDAIGVLAGSISLAGGLPSPAELVAHYAEHSDRDLSAIDWYAVLACFKLGIVLEGTHARACAGKAPVATGDFLHSLALGLFGRAQKLIGDTHVGLHH